MGLDILDILATFEHAHQAVNDNTTVKFNGE